MTGHDLCHDRSRISDLADLYSRAAITYPSKHFIRLEFSDFLHLYNRTALALVPQCLSAEVPKCQIAKVPKCASAQVRGERARARAWCFLGHFSS